MNREDDGMPLDQANWPHTTPLDETTLLLIRVRNFIQRGWCRDAIARDADGNQLVDARSAEAVEWCSIGALEATGVECFDPSFIPAIRRLEVAMRTECIARFNDHQMTVDPVLAAFDRAIAAEDPTIARIGPDMPGRVNESDRKERSQCSVRAA
jgi:hypothetical protein